MSSSEAARPTVAVAAEARSHTTEIFIINSRFERIGRGVGRLQMDLPPGLYSVKFKAGAQVHEEPLVVRAGMEPITIRPPFDLLVTPIPLEASRSGSEDHRNLASAISKRVHARMGTGSRLFVFVRDLDEEGEEGTKTIPRDDTATGLTLRALDGAILADFAKGGEHCLETQEKDKWAGCTLELSPGSYRLCVEIEPGKLLEQIVVTCPGWQTQVFLMRRVYGHDPLVLRADLNEAAISMSYLGQGFDPHEEETRAAEIARLALAQGRLIATPETVTWLLQQKFLDPILGLYGAHLMLLNAEPHPIRLKTVTDRLHDLLGDHPDVRALYVWLKDEIQGRRPFETPPMLRSSWKIIVDATPMHPQLIPAGSLATWVSPYLCSTGVWCVWKTPPPVSSETIRGEVDLSQLYSALSDVAATLPEERNAAQTETVARRLGLSGLEKTLYQYIANVAHEKDEVVQVKTSNSATRGRTSRALSFAGESHEESDTVEVSAIGHYLSESTLVQNLGVPTSALQAAMDGMLSKLKRTQ